jgi:hypothetical protein
MAFGRDRESDYVNEYIEESVKNPKDLPQEQASGNPQTTMHEGHLARQGRCFRHVCKEKSNPKWQKTSATATPERLPDAQLAHEGNKAFP